MLLITYRSWIKRPKKLLRQLFNLDPVKAGDFLGVDVKDSVVVAMIAKDETASSSLFDEKTILQLLDKHSALSMVNGVRDEFEDELADECMNALIAVQQYKFEREIPLDTPSFLQADDELSDLLDEFPDLKSPHKPGPT